MKFDVFKFAIVFWTVFILALTIHCYTRYKNLIGEFSFLTGKVVDQIPKRLGKGRDAMRPQIEYVIDDGTRYFVDRNVALKVGEMPTLIYEKSNPANFHVYNFWMWIHWGVIVPSFLISLLVFRIIVILVSKPASKTEILPGNF